MTTLQSVYAGTTVRLDCAFADVTGAPANPATVTLTVTRPDAGADVFTGGQLTNPSTGLFYRDYQLAQAGTYEVRWQSTGTPTVTNKGTIDVRAF